MTKVRARQNLLCVVVAVVIVAGCGGDVSYEEGKRDFESARAEVHAEVRDAAKAVYEEGTPIVKARGSAYGCNLSSPTASGNIYSASIRTVPSRESTSRRVKELVAVLQQLGWKERTVQDNYAALRKDSFGADIVVERPNSGPASEDRVSLSIQSDCVTSELDVSYPYEDGEDVALPDSIMKNRADRE